MREASSVVLLVDESAEKLALYQELFFLVDGLDFLLADSYQTAVKKAKKHLPFIVFANISLGQHDGLELLEEIRRDSEETFFVIYNSITDDYLEATALEQGADEFIHAEISVKVLQRKMANIVKRLRSRVKRDVLHKNGLSIDRDRYLVEKSGEQIALPRKEFEMLYLLASKPEKVFRRDELTQLIWGKIENTKKSRTIDVHVRKLRTKIGSEYIKTVKGVGYRF